MDSVSATVSKAKMPERTAHRSSYLEVMRSSVLIGGSQAANIVLGMIRTKVFAILLGPSGIGLVGIYTSIIDVVRNFAGLGINSSGVRQIAEAVSTGDSKKIARTVVTLRRVAVLSGLLGAFLLVLLSGLIARFTFGTAEKTTAIAFLALAILFAEISAGQTALVQGMRKVADLAKMGVLGGIYGTVFGITIVYFMGEQGIVFSLIAVAAMGIITSWWYARKVRVERVPVSGGEFKSESSELLKLGIVFMASGLFSMGAAYLNRLIILRGLGIDAAGYFQAAWTLGGLYVGFILQAMGADFYPRLTAAVRDHPACNRIVNEQCEVGLLIAGPGVMATLALASPVITIFYSREFAPAIDLLRWISLGMLMRVISWPIGYILLARGERKLFFWVEFLFHVVLVSSMFFGVHAGGLSGAGAAFFATYLIYWFCIYFIAKRLTGFRVSQPNLVLIGLYVPTIAILFSLKYYVPEPAVTIIGVLVAGTAGVFSLKKALTLIPVGKLPRVVASALRAARLLP